jgi:membrane protease YdiL (CAAX protease family)
MSRNYYKKSWLMAILLPAWVFVAYYSANVVVAICLAIAKGIGINLDSLNPIIFSTVLAAVVYTLTLVVAIGVPWWALRSKTTMKSIGLDRLPTWTDIFAAPAGFVFYAIFASLLMALMLSIFPWINVEEAQNVGFENLTLQYEYILAFITLVVIAPVAEEVLFRGYLYDKLKKAVPVWVAILITSLLFGYVHGAWNVAINTFALSVVLCKLRDMTGGLWASILLHMLKNAVAFYFLFINTSLFAIIG